MNIIKNSLNEAKAEVFKEINKITTDELSDELLNMFNSTELKNKVNKIESNVNTHISNQTIHISQDDRNAWDAKAPKENPTFTGNVSIPYIIELDSKDPNSMTTVEWNTIKSKAVSLETLKQYLSYIDSTTGLDHLINFSISGGGTSNTVTTDFKDDSNIVLNLTSVDSTILTGVINPSRLNGFYDIEVTNSSKLGNNDSTYYAPITSPTFKGTPTATTPPTGDSTTRLATTEFVKNKLDEFASEASGSSEKLAHPQKVTISGLVTGEASSLFDGTAPINIIATELDLSNYRDQLFTEEYKTKLEGIEEGANNYIHPSSHPASMITGMHSVATSGDYNSLINKPTIPTKTSELINDSNFVTSEAGGQVDSAIKDAAGNIITDTYIKNISISNGDLVYTLGNNTSNTVDIRIPADTIEGLATVATSGSYNDLKDAPSFNTVFTSGEYGQVLKINKAVGDIIADDNFHVLRVVSTTEDEEYYKTIPGVSMSDVFNDWERITDYNKNVADGVWHLADNWTASHTTGYKDGQNVTDDGSVAIRNKWTFDSASNTIKNNGNYHILQAFISNAIATTYSMKCRVRYVDDDDDIFAIIIAYMVDENNVHHHISMVRNLSAQNQNPYKFSLWYDLYNPTQTLIYDATSQVTNPSGVSGTRDNYIDVNIIKKEASLVCQSSDYSKIIGGDLKYSFTWNMPEAKPDGWSEEMWSNVQKMMSPEGARFGVGSVSQDVAFTIIESVGLFADNKIYNLESNTIFDFINGEYVATGSVTDGIPYRTFLYNNEMNKLYFFVKPNEYYQIATGSGSSGGGTSSSATNDSLGQNISTTYIKSLSYDANKLTYTKGNGTSTDLTISLPVTSITDIATVGKTNSYNDLDNKPTIPTKLSELTNDAGYVKADENNEYTLNTIISDSITSDTIDTDSLTIGDWKLIPTGNGLEIQYQGITKGTITTEGQIKVSEIIEI